MVDWTDEAAAAAALRARGVETDLGDPQLHAYALAAVQEIAARGYGPRDGLETYHDGTDHRFLTLDPPASAVSAVTEAGELLDASAYRLRPGGLFLERLDAGGYPSTWRGSVLTAYDTAPAGDRHDRVIVDLVKLALQFSGLSSRNDGDYSESGPADYQGQREQLIAELAPATIGFA